MPLQKPQTSDRGSNPKTVTKKVSGYGEIITFPLPEVKRGFERMIQEIVTEHLDCCPFCGGKAELKVIPHPIRDNELVARVSCPDCHCSGNTYMTGKTMDFKGEPGKCITLAEAKEKAAAAWNKRQAAIKGMEQQEQAREIYINSMPFSKVAVFMKKATEAADLFKYADIEDSLFCERMMKLYGCVPLESDKSNLITFLITLFNYGKVQGIRAERAKKRGGVV